MKESLVVHAPVKKAWDDFVMFTSEERPDGINMISREIFSVFPILLRIGFFIRHQVRQLTISFLDGLRMAAEN